MAYSAKSIQNATPHRRHEDVSYPLGGGPLHGAGGEGCVEQLMVTDHLGTEEREV